VKTTPKYAKKYMTNTSNDIKRAAQHKIEKQAEKIAKVKAKAAEKIAKEKAAKKKKAADKIVAQQAKAKVAEEAKEKKQLRDWIKECMQEGGAHAGRLPNL
jgi:hypothetical protein